MCLCGEQGDLTQVQLEQDQHSSIPSEERNLEVQVPSRCLPGAQHAQGRAQPLPPRCLPFSLWKLRGTRQRQHLQLLPPSGCNIP